MLAYLSRNVVIRNDSQIRVDRPILRNGQLHSALAAKLSTYSHIQTYTEVKITECFIPKYCKRIFVLCLIASVVGRCYVTKWSINIMDYFLIIIASSMKVCSCYLLVHRAAGIVSPSKFIVAWFASLKLRHICYLSLCIMFLKRGTKYGCTDWRFMKSEDVYSDKCYVDLLILYWYLTATSPSFNNIHVLERYFASRGWFSFGYSLNLKYHILVHSNLVATCIFFRFPYRRIHKF